MADRKSREILIRRINFVWYPLALLPIGALFLAGAYGYLPFFVTLFALFLLIFWFCSLGFALYARFSKKKDLRQ
jgi:hypothetical protein